MTRNEKIDALMSAFIQLKRTMHKYMVEVGGMHATPAQIEILTEIQRGSTRISDIAVSMHATTSAATQHVNQLVEQGLVVKSASASDKREVVLKLTQAGIDAIEKKHVLMRRKIAFIVEALSDEELDRFIAISQKIANHKETK